MDDMEERVKQKHKA